MKKNIFHKKIKILISYFSFILLKLLILGSPAYSAPELLADA